MKEVADAPMPEKPQSRENMKENQNEAVALKEGGTVTDNAKEEAQPIVIKSDDEDSDSSSGMSSSSSSQDSD